MNGGIGADDEGAFIELARAGKKLFSFTFGFEEPLGDRVEPPAEIGEPNSAALAQDELDAVSLFELADVIGNRRLGQRQLGGGARKSAMGGNRVEGFELGVTHIGQTYGYHKNMRFDL